MRLAAHDGKSLDRLSKTSNFYCCPGRAGGLRSCEDDDGHMRIDGRRLAGHANTHQLLDSITEGSPALRVAFQEAKSERRHERRPVKQCVFPRQRLVIAILLILEPRRIGKPSDFKFFNSETAKSAVPGERRRQLAPSP